MFGASSVWEEALTSSFMSSHSSGCAVGPTEREKACGLRVSATLSLQLCAHRVWRDLPFGCSSGFQSFIFILLR